jgi:hypothetical protein
MKTKVKETGVKNNPNLYDTDFYLWIKTTAQLLEEEQFSEIDLANLIEEIKDMGKQQKTSLKSNLIIILMHLLKYKYQREKRSRSWLLTIFEHRRRIKEALEDSPSLNNYYQQVFNKCYQNARKEASIETGLKLNTFPKVSPFDLEQTLNQEYLPEE